MISLSGAENVISIAWVMHILFVNKVKMEIETTLGTLYLKDDFNRYTKNRNTHICLPLLSYIMQVDAARNSHLCTHLTADLQTSREDILLMNPWECQPPYGSFCCTVKCSPEKRPHWDTLPGPTEVPPSYHQVLWAGKSLRLRETTPEKDTDNGKVTLTQNKPQKAQKLEA